MKFICVFCGSSEQGALKYAEITKKIGQTIVANGYGLVYGAGNVGLMKVLADSVLEAGGEVIGVITPEVRQLGVVHAGIKKENLYEEQTYSARKARMAALSVGFLALPGGLGTLDELTEVAIYNQFAGYKNTPDNPVKPCAILNADGFFDGLSNQLTRCREEKFMTQKHLDMILFTRDPIAAVMHIIQFKGYTPDDSRWWEASNEKAKEKRDDSAKPISAVSAFWNNKLLTLGSGAFKTGLFAFKMLTQKNGDAQINNLSSMPKLS